MLSDLRESFVEILVVPGIEDRLEAGFDADGAVAVQLNFVGPIRSIRQLGNHGAFHRVDEVCFSFRMSFESRPRRQTFSPAYQYREHESKPTRVKIPLRPECMVFLAVLNQL